MKRIVITIFVFLYAIFFFWYAGTDFSVRSAANAVCLFSSTVIALFVYFYPGWE
jgi:hypothetical protein